MPWKNVTKVSNVNGAKPSKSKKSSVLSEEQNKVGKICICACGMMREFSSDLPDGLWQTPLTKLSSTPLQSFILKILVPLDRQYNQKPHVIFSTNVILNEMTVALMRPYASAIHSLITNSTQLADAHQIGRISSLYAKQERCVRTVQRIEDSGGFKFDWVFVTRPDIFYFEDLTGLDHLSRGFHARLRSWPKLVEGPFRNEVAHDVPIPLKAREGVRSNKSLNCHQLMTKGCIVIDDQLSLVSREYLEGALQRKHDKSIKAGKSLSSTCHGEKICPGCGGGWPEPVWTNRIFSRCIPFFTLGLLFSITKLWTIRPRGI